MADEPQPQTIKERMAALKLAQQGDGHLPKDPPPSYNHPTNNMTTTGRPKPPPPPRPTLPARPVRAASSNVPTQNGTHTSNGAVANLPEEAQMDGTDGPARPALPARTSTQSLQSPALPPRRPSESPALPSRRPSAAPSSDSRRPSSYSLSRRESNDSMSSIGTTRSGTSVFSNGTSMTSRSDHQYVKAPAYDPSAALPALPPKRTQEEREADLKKYQSVGSTKHHGLKPRKSTPSLQPKQVGTTPPPPARPSVRQAPTLPSRTNPIQEEPAKVQSPPLPSRASTFQPEPARTQAPPPARETVPPPPRKSALTMGMNQSTNTAPKMPQRPGSVPHTDGAGPPPIPTGSRPDLAALKATKPSINGGSTAAAPPAATSASSCLQCRDFSAPDNHAARFPRQALPSQDIGWLANQLTAPFPSHTDKARAIFTWLHHNIEYDTVAFFNHNVKPSTPQSTLTSGLAVCEGYAGLFAALAMKVGLEAYVFGGNGKGFGYSELKPGEPIPPYSGGHAWSVVRIDGGQWKLLDACWGAGAVQGAGQPYIKRFVPERFTQSNDEFGLDHFPEDSSKQFRSDGRVMGWEEYITGNKDGCGASFYSGFVAEEGMAKTSFRPIDGKISLSLLPGPSVRFNFQKICPHWDPVRCGKGAYHLYVLALDGLEGTKRNHVPFETNGDVWWCDIPVADLGRPGGKAQIYAVTKFDGGEGRGLTIERYRQRMGRCGYAFGGVCKWEVVA